MHYTKEEIEHFRREAAKEAARKANALTPDEKETLIALLRDHARQKGTLRPRELRQWASELLGRELAPGDLLPLVSAQLDAVDNYAYPRRDP